MALRFLKGALFKRQDPEVAAAAVTFISAFTSHRVRSFPLRAHCTVPDVVLSHEVWITPTSPPFLLFSHFYCNLVARNLQLQLMGKPSFQAYSLLFQRSSGIERTSWSRSSLP